MWRSGKGIPVRVRLSDGVATAVVVRVPLHEQVPGALEVPVIELVAAPEAEAVMELVCVGTGVNVAVPAADDGVQAAA